MTEIPARDLRNHVSEILRRVESGEEMVVTVSGRPVATLVPIKQARPRFLSTADVLSWPKTDAALYGELREMLPDTTDDEDEEWAHP